MGNYTPNPFMTQLAHLPPLVLGDSDGDGGSVYCGCGRWWLVAVGVICWVEMEECEFVA